MDGSHSGLRACWYCMLSGFALMNMALFLHPMSPEDFLELVFSDPLLTIADANGYGMAVFFWISVLVMLFGLLGLLGRSQCFHRILRILKSDLKAVIN